jgi:hypothetical protein
VFYGVASERVGILADLVREKSPSSFRLLLTARYFSKLSQPRNVVSLVPALTAMWGQGESSKHYETARLLNRVFENSLEKTRTKLQTFFTDSAAGKQQKEKEDKHSADNKAVAVTGAGAGAGASASDSSSDAPIDFLARITHCLFARAAKLNASDKEKDKELKERERRAKEKADREKRERDHKSRLQREAKARAEKEEKDRKKRETTDANKSGMWMSCRPTLAHFAFERTCASAHLFGCVVVCSRAESEGAEVARRERGEREGDARGSGKAARSRTRKRAGKRARERAHRKGEAAEARRRRGSVLPICAQLHFGSVGQNL